MTQRQTEPETDAEIAAEIAAATVVVPSALAAFAGNRSHLIVPLTEGTIEGPRSPLSAVLDALRREVPALERRIRDERGQVRGHVNIYVDGTDIRELAGVSTVIVPGATVHLIAAVSGG